MTRGKVESGSASAGNKGLTTRAGKISGIPKMAASPRTPSGGSQKKEPSDLQRVFDKLDSLESRLESKLDDAIKSQEVNSSNMSERVGKSEEQGLVLDEKVSALKEDTEGIRMQVKVQGARLVDIEDKIERIEREKRRNILVIDGYQEKEGERVHDILGKVLVDLNVGFNSGVCTVVSRRGKQPGDNKRDNNNRPRTRPIVVFFPSQAEKSSIFRNLKNLKDKEEWRNIFFNDDLTEQQANEQRDLRALAAYAKNKGFNASVRAGFLCLDGRRYRYDEIHRLPEGITLINAKNLHILDDKAIVFQSPHSPLSNLYPCNITFRGDTFLSAEGAFQFSRASVSGYHRVAQLIKSERNAFKVKSMARDLKASAAWEDMAEQVMREILIEKFKRNKFCCSFILATGTRALFEGTGDRRWGCGIQISKAHLITFKNPGRNLLGHLLEEVRGLLQSK